MSEPTFKDLLLLGAVSGGGIYSALRGIQQLKEITKEKPEELHSINISLPASRLKKQSTELLAPIAGLVTGFGGGFLGANALYNAYKRRELTKERAELEKSYLEYLDKINKKHGSETPCVDSLCETIIEKQAQEAPEYFSTLTKHTLNNINDSDIGRLLAQSLGLTALAGGVGGYVIARQKDLAGRDKEVKTTIPTQVKLNLV